MTPPSRIFMLACVIAPLLGGAVVACTAGDEVAYAGSAPPPTSDSGVDGGNEAGRIVTEGGVVRILEQNDGGSWPLPSPINCGTAGLDLDGGPCDPNAGLGCCLVAAGLTTSDNQCDTQGQFFLGTSNFCRAQGDVFLSCLGSNTDSTCCWQPDTSGFHTRFRSGCDGGFEACDVNADGGGSCGGVLGLCNKTTCKGVEVGYCGDTKPCR